MSEDHTTDAQENGGLPDFVYQDSQIWSPFNVTGGIPAGSANIVINAHGSLNQPVEQMIPMSQYNNMARLWVDTRNENDQLRQDNEELRTRISELEAQMQNVETPVCEKESR